MNKREGGLLNPMMPGQQNLNKNPASQFNPLQKDAGNKVESGKK